MSELYIIEMGGLSLEGDKRGVLRVQRAAWIWAGLLFLSFFLLVVNG